MIRRRPRPISSPPTGSSSSGRTRTACRYSTPFEGAAYCTAVEKAKRKALNDWIRTSKMYDGMIDLDAVVRDPNHATESLPRYDSGDHLRPGAAGYQAMAAAIDLALFKSAVALRQAARAGEE